MIYNVAEKLLSWR